MVELGRVVGEILEDVSYFIFVSSHGLSLGIK